MPEPTTPEDQILHDLRRISNEYDKLNKRASRTLGLFWACLAVGIPLWAWAVFYA